MNEESELHDLKEYLRAQGFECEYYRDPFIKRRLALRMARSKAKTYGAYLKYLSDNPSEYQALVDCLAVNVTSFFRDHTPFQTLKHSIFPDLANRRRIGDKAIHVWSAACATGEEPYSIAMTAMESIGAEMAAGKAEVRIVATDIDEDALQTAQEGLYKAAAVEPIDEKLRRRYFRLGEAGYQIKENIRSMVTFKTLNLINDRPLPHTDLIFCRNMLIYIQSPYQDAIFEKFSESLRPGGYLVIGNTETLPGRFQSRFKTLDLANRVYQKEGQQ